MIPVGIPQTPVDGMFLAEPRTSLAPSYITNQQTLPSQITHSGGATIYHHIDPFTNKVVDSFLPPDHPIMQCMHEGHVPHSKFGIGGIIAAVCWFPLGFWMLMADRDVICARCGMMLKPGSHPFCKGKRRSVGSMPTPGDKRIARH
jgi:hypothetical protein